MSLEALGWNGRWQRVLEAQNSKTQALKTMIVKSETIFSSSQAAREGPSSLA
jgi:hypothetical protein